MLVHGYSYNIICNVTENIVSAYEAAISGKMPDVNVFKQFKNKKSAEALILVCYPSGRQIK